MAEQKYPFVWRANPEILEWTRKEAEKLRLSVAETIEAGLTFWKEYIDKEGDQAWKP